MTRRAYAHRVPMNAPDDVGALEAGFASGAIHAACVVAILGKTEGNGCVNDFSRGFATRALTDALARGGADPAKVCLVMSGGSEGGLAPHMLVLEARETDEAPGEAALALGRARTQALAPEDLGRLAQVDRVAEGVLKAIGDAGLASPADAHFVQIKCPLLTAARIGEAEARGRATATRDTLKSMALSRAASALGVAVALGEISRSALREEDIGRTFALYSGRASASAGVELIDHEIVVLGASARWGGPLRIGHALMRDAIDVEPVRAALLRLGVGAVGQVAPGERDSIVAVLAKAEASSDGRLRGRRHTMLNDSDIASTRHARAFVAGALAGLVGHAEIYVSGGAEHQGPDGGGPVALIVDASAERRSPS